MNHVPCANITLSYVLRCESFRSDSILMRNSRSSQEAQEAQKDPDKSSSSCWIQPFQVSTRWCLNSWDGYAQVKGSNLVFAIFFILSSFNNFNRLELFKRIKTWKHEKLGRMKNLKASKLPTAVNNFFLPRHFKRFNLQELWINNEVGS